MRVIVEETKEKFCRMCVWFPRPAENPLTTITFSEGKEVGKLEMCAVCKGGDR